VVWRAKRNHKHNRRCNRLRRQEIKGVRKNLYHLFALRESVILSLWAGKRSVAGHEYARLNTTASITGENSGNGALPIRESEQGENKDNSANDRRARNAHTKRLRLGADQEQRLRGSERSSGLLRDNFSPEDRRDSLKRLKVFAVKQKAAAR
jgi:hypothetical protein